MNGRVMTEPSNNERPQSAGCRASWSASFDVLASRCNAESNDDRTLFAGTLARLFVQSRATETRLGEFVEALVAGRYPALLEDLRKSADIDLAAARRNRPDIPDQRGRPSRLSWRQAEGKVVSIAFLKRLPDDLRLPEDLPEPLRYDAASRQLQYRGYMGKDSYDFLRSLHRDVEYQRALETLFRESSTAFVPKEASRVPGFLRQLLKAFRLRE